LDRLTALRNLIVDEKLIQGRGINVERECPHTWERAHPVKIEAPRAKIEIAGGHEPRALSLDPSEAGTLSRIDTEVIVHEELPVEHLHPAVLTTVIVQGRDGSGSPVEQEHLETPVRVNARTRIAARTHKERPAG
jgi:hypothetical protein